MNKLKFIPCLLVLTLFIGTHVAVAQKSKKKEATEVSAEPVTLKPGDTAPYYKLKNVDEIYRDLTENSKGAILVFTCNHCPFSKNYESRIIELHNKFSGSGYPVVAINPNDPTVEPEDGFLEMQKIAITHKYPFPYLVDETQETAKAYGAARTPHVFVVQKAGDKFIVKYVGAIDDNADDPAAATHHYVEEAVNELLNNVEVSIPETKAIGCSIKWKK